MYVCIFIKLHITAQSGLVILVILCHLRWSHSRWSSQGGINDTCYENLWSNATKGTHSLYLYKSYLSPEHLVLPPLLPCSSPGYPSWQLLNHVCMYVWLSHIARAWINRVRLPILLVVSSTGTMNISLSPFAPENLASRDRVGSPVPRQPAHLHTQAESGAYLRDSSRFRGGVHSFI